MIKVVVASDMHGQFFDVPECDLFLLAGDLCPTYNHRVDFQAHWLDTEFRWWLKKIPAKKVVGIFGNHDFIGENPHKVPSLPWTYLQDSKTEFEGYKIWGSPHQPIFFDWAFNLPEKDLVEKWKLIPKDTDILVVHGPPYGYGDKAPRMNGRGYEHVGSPGLLDKIKEVKPKLFCTGHIHEARGIYQIPELPDTIIANATILNGQYQMVYEPMVFELPSLQS